MLNLIEFLFIPIDENLKGGIWECPPLCEIFTKMRLCQTGSHRNTPEKREEGNLHLAIKVMTFFPWRPHHGPTRGWYGNVSDIQNSIYQLCKVYLMSNNFEIIFSQIEVAMSPISIICWCDTHTAHISHFLLPLKTPPRKDEGRVRGT